MPRDDRNRDLASMQDMLRSIETVLDEASVYSKESLGNDPDRRDATLYRFIVLGEAANRVSEETRALHPEIPWKFAWRMRNVLAHAYDSVSWDIVWQTIQTDLPPLERTLREALGLDPRSDRAPAGDRT